MFSNACSWAGAGMLALATTVSLPLAAEAAPFAPIATTSFAGTTPAPTLVQGEGRDSSASGAYRRRLIPDQQSGQTTDDQDVRAPQGASKQGQKSKKRDGGGSSAPVQSGQRKKKLVPN